MNEPSHSEISHIEPEHTQDKIHIEDRPEFESIENLQLKLNYVQKMLESKEESVKILDDNLKSTKRELADFKKCFYDIQIDRDVKIKEISNLQRAIDFHINTIDELQREKLDSQNEILYNGFEDESNSSLIFSNSKLQNEIKSLKFDLDVMESLYKNCYEEMINQEKTINNLRQACLDYSMKEINLKTDIEMLMTQLRSIKKSQLSYADNDGLKSYDIEKDLSEISIHLNCLKQTLLADITLEDDDKNMLCENLKTENKKLKNEITTLRLEHDKLKSRKSKTKCKCKSQNTQILSSYMKTMASKMHQLEDTNMKEEIDTVKSQLFHYENNIAQYDKNMIELNNKIVSLENTIKIINDKNGSKTDRILWLESQLSESTERGAEMCKNSNDIFQYVQQLLQQVKEERRKVSEKKVMLQKVLKFLAGKEDILKYINCDSFLKN